MRKSFAISVLLFTFAGLGHAQSLFAFSIGGLGLATNLSQCPPPASNYANICPVIGQGFLYTMNGSPYVSWQGPQGIQGNPGTNGANGTNGQNGQQGIQGPPGVIVGNTLNGVLTCQPAKGQSIPSGFATACTFKVTGIQ